MTAVVNIDFDEVNADWPKRTNDRRASLLRPAGAVYDLTDLRFNPSQPRDADGKWGSGSGGGAQWDAADARGALAESIGTEFPTFGFKDGDRKAAKQLAAESVAGRMTSSTEEMVAEAEHGRTPALADSRGVPIPERIAITAQPHDTLAYSTVIVGRLPNGDLDVQDVGNGYDISHITGKDDPVRADVMRLADRDGWVDFGDGQRWAVAGTNAGSRLARESVASDLIDQWARSSNGTVARSHAVQQAARDEFGITDAAEWQTAEGKENAAAAGGRMLYSKHAGMYRDFVRAQYEGTQEWLKGHGVGSVVMYRGVRVAVGADDDLTKVRTRPLSSWSYTVESASKFTENQMFDEPGANGVVFTSVVPASRILSTPITGSGCLVEDEMVVLGGVLATKGDRVGFQ
jgi:hypothetical protein